MSFTVRMKRKKHPGILLGLALGLASVAAAGGAEWKAIPAHETRGGMAGGFERGRYEATAAEFAEYLNGAGVDGYPETAQIRRVGGGYEVRRGAGAEAVAEVTAAEAEGFCRWITERTGRKVRLPTEEEWEAAARGGIDGAPYPWGWGGDMRKMARFDAEGPARKGGVHPANGFGLFDVAGNVFEWCAPAEGVAAGDGTRAARGGAWSERNPAMLRVDRSTPFPAGYRGRDVGFRLLREGLGAP